MVPDPRGSPPDPSSICFTKAGQPSLAATRPWGGALTQPGEPVLALRRPRAARGPGAGRGRPLGGATWSAVKDLGVREALGCGSPQFLASTIPSYRQPNLNSWERRLQFL